MSTTETTVTTTKTDLVEDVAESAGIPKAAATRAIDALTDRITNDLSNGVHVTLTGFGSFSVSHRQARMGRNPQTGAEISIPASITPRFKAGKKLKEAVNKN